MTIEIEKITISFIEIKTLCAQRLSINDNVVQIVNAFCMKGNDDGYLESALLADVTFFNARLNFADALLKN